MERYASVSQCIDDWEFCPLCHKRNNIDIGFYNDPAILSVKTTLNNTSLQCIDIEDKLILMINLRDNNFTVDHQSFQSFMRIGCKNFHWTITFGLLAATDNPIRPWLDKVSFFICDKKLQYNITSNYLTNITNISVGNRATTLQDFSLNAIRFNKFEKKSLIKNIKALCLLI